MARLLKNPDISTGSLGVKLPIGTTTLSDAPVTGLIRFNTDNSRIEFFYNNAWNQVAKIGSVQLAVDQFTSDGITTQVFTMSQSESDPKSIAVFIGGVYQQPTVNYIVDGSTNITFTSVPPAPTGMSPNQIVVIHNINSTNVAA
jgi:hypothetical protein